MKKNSFNYDELISCAEGKLFGAGNAKLPLPPMLMFDRITEIFQDKGEFKKGLIKAELDIKKSMWFFDCHFKDDPVMPGCLGLDAMWQLVGFFLGWTGEPGKGRALGVNSVKFTGEVLKKFEKASRVKLSKNIFSTLFEPFKIIAIVSKIINEVKLKIKLKLFFMNTPIIKMEKIDNVKKISGSNIFKLFIILI